MTIKAKDPSPKAPPAADWSKVAKQIKKKPGTWFLVKEGAPFGVANALRANKIAAFKELDIEITTRNNNRETKTADVYVRLTTEEN